MTINRLAELGITLPRPPAPAGSYRPFVLESGLLFISGQAPFDDKGRLITGRVGETLNVEQGIAASRACGQMLLAQMLLALDGQLNRVTQIIRVSVFVSSAADFVGQPTVANGVSELMELVFGEAGQHARTAIGVPVLPLGIAVEVDAIVAVAP